MTDRELPTLAEIMKSHNPGATASCFACQGSFVFTIESGGLCPECNDADHDRCVKYNIECDCPKCYDESEGW